MIVKYLFLASCLIRNMSNSLEIVKIHKHCIYFKQWEEYEDIKGYLRLYWFWSIHKVFILGEFCKTLFNVSNIYRRPDSCFIICSVIIHVSWFFFQFIITLFIKLVTNDVHHIHFLKKRWYCHASKIFTFPFRFMKNGIKFLKIKTYVCGSVDLFFLSRNLGFNKNPAFCNDIYNLK